MSMSRQSAVTSTAACQISDSCRVGSATASVQTSIFTSPNMLFYLETALLVTHGTRKIFTKFNFLRRIRRHFVGELCMA